MLHLGLRICELHGLRSYRKKQSYDELGRRSKASRPAASGNPLTFDLCLVATQSLATIRAYTTAERWL
jgi:hypothetical protein